jgi:hypothetical protein
MAGVDETLGLLGHPGGILVDHPRLRVGVVKAVSRTDSLTLELTARSPFTPDTTATPTPRVLLPRYDEGMNLRVAWLDADGRPHWEYGTTDTGIGPAFRGPVLRTELRLPPTFGSVDIVLAWPEIAFPEAVVTLPLPDRDAVARSATSIWTAPVDHLPLAPGTTADPVARESLDVTPEAGLVLTGQRVLHRGEDAAVVLTRLSLVGPALSMEIDSVARGRRGGAATMTSMYGPSPRSRPADPRDVGIGASVGLLDGDRLSWLSPTTGGMAGGDDSFHGRAEYAFTHPDSDALDLVVGWPVADLPDAVDRVPLVT